MSGVDVVTVAARVGHKSSKMTLDVYGHVMDEVDYRAANIIANTIYKREA